MNHELQSIIENGKTMVYFVFTCKNCGYRFANYDIAFTEKGAAADICKELLDGTIYPNTCEEVIMDKVLE